MALLTFAELRGAAQIYLLEWAFQTIRGEMLLPIDNTGTSWVSEIWNGPVLPPDIGGVEPTIVVDGISVIRGTGAGKYVVASTSEQQVKITFGTPTGSPNTIVQATYKRGFLTDSFWTFALRTATNSIATRLLQSNVNLTVDGGGITNVDDSGPWHIYVEQTALIALLNLQTLFAGLGRSQFDSMVVDLSQIAVGNLMKATTEHLSKDIVRDVEAWRWANSAGPRYVLPAPLCGPIWRNYCC